MGHYRDLEDAAFASFMGDPSVDNYDPDYYDEEDSFDPEVNNASGGKRRRHAPGGSVTRVVSKTGVLSFTLTNNTAQRMQIELFAPNRGIFTVRDATMVNPNLPNYGYWPLNTSEGIAAYLNSQGVTLNAAKGNVYFNAAGDGVIGGAAADPLITIQCAEHPYSALLDHIKGNPFKIDTIKFTFDSAPQIDEKLTFFSNTFLGAESKNQISPRTAFKSTQYQNLTVDFPLPEPYTVTADKGIRYALLANQRVQMDFLVSVYSKTTL